jgi:hypothetical protein
MLRLLHCLDIGSQIAVRLSALSTSCPLVPGRSPGPISVRGSVDPRAIVQLEGLGQLETAVTESGIKLQTIRFVAECLKELRYHVHLLLHYVGIIHCR